MLTMSYYIWYANEGAYIQVWTWKPKYHDQWCFIGRWFLQQQFVLPSGEDISIATRLHWLTWEAVLGGMLSINIKGRVVQGQGNNDEECMHAKMGDMQ